MLRILVCEVSCYRQAVRARRGQDNRRMLPIEVSPWEVRQVGLLAKRHGSDPDAFQVRKFAAPQGRYTVRVVARGAATVYDIDTPHD